MIVKEKLIALAERCEAAVGPDYRLNHDIALALGWERRGILGWYSSATTCVGELPKFTASLDAAMTLVPEGWGWNVESDGSAILEHGRFARLPVIRANAATPALALCAAALRARAAQ